MNLAKAKQLFIFMQPAMTIHFLPLSLKGTATPSKTFTTENVGSLHSFHQSEPACAITFSQSERANEKYQQTTNQGESVKYSHHRPPMTVCLLRAVSLSCFLEK